ncbi:MAG: hypothetical protein M3R55_01975 [Acidobacteriota bacterium]|nr:hypothetical protein [Acidobacteriota bacterium]
MTIREPLNAWTASALYAAAACWWTWPLVSLMGSRIAWDLGDPLLVAWIMGWVNDSVSALLRGDAGRFLAMWDAPIFHPQPLTLAYSEHFIPQALLVWPVHAATGNVILSYNAALLMTFVLSALGVFLLARELTGSAAASLLAGALYGFSLYRVDQLSHLQVLSSQWLPFALFGLRRYFVTLRARPLVWASLAIVAQNLSSGYYLYYGLPFIVAYVIGEMWSRGYLTRRDVWRDIAAAGTGTAVLTVPFLVPYLAARESVGGRSYAAVREFSADIYGYATASAYNGWWRNVLDAFRYAENGLFPGLFLLLFAAAAGALLGAAAVKRWRAAARGAWRRDALGVALLIAAVLSLGVAIWIALTGGRILQIQGLEVRVRNLSRILSVAMAFSLLAAMASKRIRDGFAGERGSLAGPALIAAAAAFLLSLGPRTESMNEFIGHGPYAILMKVLPGIDGLRVPARFAMLVVLFLSIAGAYAAAWIARRGRLGTAAVILAAGAAVWESRPYRFDLDGESYVEGYAQLAIRHRLGFAEPLYQHLARTEPGVLLEFPWGTTGWDLQYMLAQRRHGWPLVNGYSGHFPASYMRTSTVLNVFDSPDRAWWGLERSGASHVIVHEWAFLSIERGERVSQWLRDNGAVELAATDHDTLFRLPGGILHR